MGRKGSNICFVVLLVAGTPFMASAQAGGPAAGDDTMERGEQIYIAQCSRCHGIEGAGGQGPMLARANLPKGRSVEAISAIVNDGLPDGGMPGTWSLSQNEVRLVAEYVLTLGEIPVEDLPGDPGRGEQIFFGKGRCTNCHIVGGQGEGFGPELTDVGARRNADNLRRSIVDPDEELPLGTGVMGDPAFVSHLTVLASDEAGDEVLGVRLNEDSFTIQLLDRRGRLHSFRKTQSVIEKQYGRSLMTERELSEEEIEDLVAYLANLRGATWNSVSDQ